MFQETAKNRDARRRSVDRLTRACGLVGVNPITMLRAIRGVPRFAGDWRAYSRLAEQAGETRFRLDAWLCYPVLWERCARAGNAGGHFCHQDLWAARKIHECRISAIRLRPVRVLQMPSGPWSIEAAA